MNHKRKRKPTRIVPGIGAARSSHLHRLLRDERIAAAQRFVDLAQKAIRLDAAVGCPHNTWTSLPLIKSARKSYLHALASDSFKALA